MPNEPTVEVPMYWALSVEDRAAIDQVLEPAVVDRANGLDRLKLMAEVAKKRAAERHKTTAADPQVE